MISWPANGTGSRCAPESLGEMRSLCRTIGECSETIKGCRWFIDEYDIFVNPIVMASLWGNLMEKHLPLEIKFERDNYATSDSVKA